jgi:hypothetical protein
VPHWLGALLQLRRAGPHSQPAVPLEPQRSCHRGAKPVQPSLRRVVLKQVVLKQVVLKQAVLKQAVLKQAVLKQAGLKQAGLKQAGLKQAGLKQAGLLARGRRQFRVELRRPPRGAIVLEKRLELLKQVSVPAERRL